MIISVHVIDFNNNKRPMICNTESETIFIIIIIIHIVIMKYTFNSNNLAELRYS